MTNQNDNQDEAERLACKYSTEVIMNNPSLKFDGASVKTGYRAGYRAGVATVADKHLELAVKYSDLAAKYCASRAEVERLKDEDGSGPLAQWKRQYLNEWGQRKQLEKQLAAEKSRAQKLVDGMIEILNKNKGTEDIYNWGEPQRSMRRFLSAYSTDPGDGGSNG